MYKKLFLILGLLVQAFHFIATGQEGRLRCLEVMPNGDVLLHWNPYTGPGFINYTIYFSPDPAGPFNSLPGITDLLQDDYLHAGAGAGSAPVYYYMTTSSSSGTSPPSDTLATMLLTLATTDFEVIDLNWNPLHTPLLQDMYPWYLLYREYPPGNWAIVDSSGIQEVDDLNLSYHFWECNFDSLNVKFRIGVLDMVTGCMSFSNQQGEVLQNSSNRYPPVIDSVSIDTSGKVIIGWEPGSEPDIQDYIIFNVTSANDPIDTVHGRFTTFYLHQASSPCNGPLRYIISSLDSCGWESPYPFDSVTFLDKPQKTIYLSDIQYDPCLMTNTLNWTGYVNLEPPLQGYWIYRSINDSAYQLLETLSPGDTTFTHINLQPITTYSYYIRAFSQGGQKTSTSCRKEVTTYNSPYPMFMYTRFVTVENNDRVNILFYTDTNAHVQSYRILRSTYAGGPYSEVGTVPDERQEFISFSDTEADVTAESYYYQIEVMDSCGIASVISNTSRTIFLEAEALPDLNNRLTWNAYESWNGRILGYKVYRRLDNSAPDLLADLDSLTLTYTDNVSALTGSASRITYLVEAYEGPNPLGSGQSYSNEVLSEQEAQVYLPNAFMPRGLNNLFKPVTIFVESEGYEFVIYNRWGQMVFRSNDPGDGWDGTYNGEYVPMGVYVYLLRFRNALNQPRQIKGNVAVLY